MTDRPHDRARSRRLAARRAAFGAVLLVLLLAALSAIRHVPAAPGSIRVGGISIEWWYGGLLAPLAGWILAVWAMKPPRAVGSAAGRPAVRAAADEPRAATLRGAGG